MPRNRLDQKAHTRAMNRASHRMRQEQPEHFAELYAQEFEKAKREVRETGGQSFKPGPRIDGIPAILVKCPSCEVHHDQEHFCPNCGNDLEVGAEPAQAEEVSEGSAAAAPLEIVASSG